jgi:hypothetical protein
MNSERKMWYTCTVEFSSATKTDEITSFAEKIDGLGDHRVK